MKLIKILSDKIQIRTDQMEFENVKINDLISISDDSIELITMVVSVTDTDSEPEIDGAEDFILGGVSVKVVECSIIGSIHDGKFSKAIDKYPTTDITAKEITADKFGKRIAFAEGKVLG